jgi:hypothetical protein
MALGFDMIVSCPSCAKRYDMDHATSDRPLQVTCSACGNRWKELPNIEVVNLEYNTLPQVIDHAREPELDVQRLVEAAKTAKQRFAAKKVARLKKLSAWISLAFCCILPFATAAFMPEAVVTIAPITIKAYDKLGVTVNVYGLDIRHVAQENKIIDGAHVLMIKGEVSNSTDAVRKIPWLRFALLSNGQQELYSWTLDTAARPLRPGETTSFVTRVAAPPELAQNLQIRFAHQDEIGSNPKP